VTQWLARGSRLGEPVARLGLDASVERVDDLEQILHFGLLALPGLVVNGQVISTGYGVQKRIEKALREWCERGAL